MDKSEVIHRICECGVVAVVRAENAEQALKIADACVKAGIAGIEVTYTVPGATDVIKSLSETYKNGEIIIGAGTVLDPETARTAILAGASFVVSPCLNTSVVEICNRYQIACMPGAMTIKEVVECMQAGADIVKVFPGELYGPAIIKAIKGPLPYAKLMPTGGVSLDNVDAWIMAGCVAVGVGGNLTAGAKKGDYQSISDIGRKFVEKVAEARVKQ
ncbi:bifunctional 2-keto-4-hydroxyglutarate aldolase/2-keto-3-deoxy-6-phosphogluconate aldolase [Acetivibrio mesophilus]|uniref:Bifunctional 4-hydroxy-2-oxoglutarate aldolase/2-dehydro-3-deoxy-phosphogluconate aldolase n=1 Tax=Acetivibrio mesophilus TaxID=2487273 RepID=A0A4Q0I2F3_9FIRM|nr:bifunctional 2-keto-4-hydroxyglutarate aldolase/2-keto-3-deoxy-6-phosphogluconate aldolase [Acetivibrio mesophilus]ODM25347.1 bifunctional 2-keto-4-hydroxyglutarate aldolase/2-keto-3-deoxy-6-phosphogluconate aldolase [Clostridium sp. Bc-iso-3]RXE58424.1 bifunctional 4-hydroxy-2-oxoglutarate aldolase/2-dehydro-3-deoxy-phosphogluconate aldolase [Acetivibrio mesophilus]HHV28650.1 bifunctional 2-keto-4-hydroxyglutarate aldolase/2-keto-3-deoxy-6-phosphogluconate aldolase [Clostridium sp.]